MKLTRLPDGKARCPWHGGHADYLAYHDGEWGWPVSDDQRLFEQVCLEGFQAGLSWLTILRKREAFRKAFANFDFHRVARFAPRRVEKLMGDSGIVRHRGKIESVIRNSQLACDLEAEFGSLAAYFWSHEPPQKERRAPRSPDDLPAKTPASIRLSKDLKQRGWTYVGPVTMHAFMQSVGLVNEHLVGCHVRSCVTRARRGFQPPQP